MRLLTLLFWFALILTAHAQSIMEERVSIQKVKSFQKFIDAVESKHAIRFFYMQKWIDPVTLDDDFQGETIGAVLDEFVSGTDLFYRVFDNYTVVISKDASQMIKQRNIISAAQREQKKIDRMVIGSEQAKRKRPQVVLKGEVFDEENNEPLSGASILINDLGTGTIADKRGRYEIKLPPGLHVVTFSFLNYEDKLIDLAIYEDGEISTKLTDSPKLLDEIIISDRANRDITTSNIGQVQFSMTEIKKRPTILGETDIIRQLQQTPGVSTVGEAASGFNVRGGSADQNLILYDGIPVLNSSHAFGFFSAFNSEAIRDVNFYRGGIPSQFGGRASSVLDINSLDGNTEKWKVNGGIGMISSNLMVNGPINKGKTSLALSSRITYSDWLVHAIRTNYQDLKNSKVFFYDGTAKLSHRFNSRSKLSLTWYSSHDQFSLGGDSTYGWSNQVAALKYDHLFSSKFQGTFTLGQGKYSYAITNKNPSDGFDLKYSITYPTLLANFNLQEGRHKISFGIQSNYYQFKPGSLQPNSPASSAQAINIEEQRSLESGLYVGDGFTINQNNFIEGGLRLSLFNSVGPAHVNQYQPDQPIEVFNQTGVATYNSIYNTYHGLEPRLAFRHNLSESSSIKFGYNRIYQYMQLVSNTAAITPADIWQPSNKYFKPQRADQVSIGYFKNFKSNLYEAFVETFYKKIENVLDFKSGAQLILNNHLETDLLQGKARAYGAEFSISKVRGLFTWSFNYTYSQSLRTITGQFPGESINNGVEYPSNFNQPHIVNLSWKYDVYRRFSITSNFTYHTGRPISYPIRSYVVSDVPVLDFVSRNQYKIPDYHRLDIAFVLAGNYKREKLWTGNWVLSFYNVYARKNAYSIFFKSENGVFHAYQLSIIGTILPSLTYSFRL